MAPNSNNRSRRSIIRSTAGIASLGGVSLFASGTGAAASSGTQGKYGYVITEDGNLAYNGDKSYMAAAVEGLNKKHDKDEIEFSMENGTVMTEATTTNSVATPNSVTTTGCEGDNDYKKKLSGSKIEHKLYVDHCNCNDIVDMLTVGVQAGALATTISGYVGNLPVVVASATATFLLRVGKQLIVNNDEGEGIVILAKSGIMGNDLTPRGLEPQ